MVQALRVSPVAIETCLTEQEYIHTLVAVSAKAVRSSRCISVPRCSLRNETSLESIMASARDHLNSSHKWLVVMHLIGHESLMVLIMVLYLLLLCLFLSIGVFGLSRASGLIDGLNSNI
jgi:hypothetical protein